MRNPPYPSVPAAIDAATQAHVLRDLHPPSSLVHAKVGAAATVGGILSMATCGQFGVGLTPVARMFSEGLHEQMGPLSCALVCGALYAVFPVAILRGFLCTSLQFKAVTRRFRRVIAVWFAGCGALFAAFGHHGVTLLHLAAWMAAALAATVALVRLTETPAFAALLAPRAAR